MWGFSSVFTSPFRKQYRMATKNPCKLPSKKFSRKIPCCWSYLKTAKQRVTHQPKIGLPHEIEHQEDGVVNSEQGHKYQSRFGPLLIPSWVLVYRRSQFCIEHYRYYYEQNQINLENTYLIRCLWWDVTVVTKTDIIVGMTMIM